MQTSQNHVVAVGVRGEMSDVALQRGEKRVDHAGRGAILRFRPKRRRNTWTRLCTQRVPWMFSDASMTKSRTAESYSKARIEEYDLRAPLLATHLKEHLEDVVPEGVRHELAQTALQLLEDLRHRGGARGQQDLLQRAAAVVVLGHVHDVAAQAFEVDLPSLGVGARSRFGLGFGLGARLQWSLI